MTKDQFFTHCVMKLGPPEGASVGAQHVEDYWDEVHACIGPREEYVEYSYVVWRAWCEAQKAEPE